MDFFKKKPKREKVARPPDFAEHRPPPPPQPPAAPPAGQPPLMVPPPPFDHHFQYETETPAPVYETPAEKPLMKNIIRPLFLASRTPVAKHPYDQASQPYIRDKMNAPIFILRASFLTLTVLEALLAAKPYEWGSNKYRTGSSPYIQTLDEDPVFDSYVGFFWASFYLALLAAIIHFILFFACFKILYPHSARTYLFLIAIQFFCLVCDSVSFVYPTTWRLIFGYLCEVMIAIVVATCGYVVWHWSFHDPKHNENRYTEFTPAKVDELWEDLLGWRFARRLAQQLSLRRRLNAIHRKGKTVFIALTLLTIAVAGTTTAYEIWKTTNGQDRIYPLLPIVGQQNTYGLVNWRNYKSRVLFVIVDALNQDSLTSNARMADFVTSLGNNFKTYNMRSAVPTVNAGNWATLISGVSPENTGLLGPYMSVEQVINMPFDTIFAETSRWSGTNGISGDPLFRSMVNPDLTPLTGDAAIDSSWGTGGNSAPTCLPADEERVVQTQQALLGGTPPDLFVTHLNNVAMQAQWYGPESVQYQSALDSLARELSTLKATVDVLTDTVMIVTGSHGTGPQRGFGGVSPLQMSVPFLLYSPNSNFGSQLFTGAGLCPAAEPQWSSIDVAPTVAALLNVPTPRQAEGGIIQDALQLINGKGSTGSTNLPLYALQDLFLQKRQWYCSYFYAVLWGEDFFSCLSHYTAQTCLSGTDISNATCDCLNNIDKIRSDFTFQRVHSLRIYFWRNWFLTLGFLFILSVLALCCADLYTFADLRSLVAGRAGESEDDLDEHHSMLMATGSKAFLRPDYERSITGRLGPAANRKALLTACLLLAAYWAFVTLTFLIGYIIVGFFFATFDEAMINLTGDLLGWLAWCLVPAICVVPLITRAYKKDLYLRPKRDTLHTVQNSVEETVHTMFRRDLGAEDEGWETELDLPESTRPIKKGWKQWLLDSECNVDNFTYLTKWYLAWLTLAVTWALLWLAAGFCSFIPVMFSTPWVTPFNWGYRFVMLSLLLMAFPLLVATLLQVAKWAPFSSWDDMWDGVFELQALKDMTRLRRHHASYRGPGGAQAAHLPRYVGRRAERLWPAWDTLHEVSALDMLDMDLNLNKQLGSSSADSRRPGDQPDPLEEFYPGVNRPRGPRKKRTFLPEQQSLPDPPALFPSLAGTVPATAGRHFPATPNPLEKRAVYDEAMVAPPLADTPLLLLPRTEG